VTYLLAEVDDLLVRVLEQPEQLVDGGKDGWGGAGGAGARRWGGRDGTTWIRWGQDGAERAGTGEGAGWCRCRRGARRGGGPRVGRGQFSFIF
jgi:hypothetical protein